MRAISGVLLLIVFAHPSEATPVADLRTGIAFWEVRGGVCPAQVVNCQVNPNIWTEAPIVNDAATLQVQPVAAPGEYWPTGAPTDAKWITKATDASGNVNGPGPLRYQFGNYIYFFRVTFNLTGFDPDTASLAGKYWADGELDATNKGSVLAGAGLAGVWLNGTPVDAGNGVRPPDSWRRQGEPFAFNAGFVPGINVLTFRVINLGHEVGLRIDDVTLDAEVVIPEPSTWIMTVTGLGLALLARRRRS